MTIPLSPDNPYSVSFSVLLGCILAYMERKFLKLNQNYTFEKGRFFKDSHSFHHSLKWLIILTGPSAAQPPCFLPLFSWSLLIKMTISDRSPNFLPGFSHSALPLRTVLWMTPLKAHHCFHLPARETTAYSSPLGNQVYLPRKSLHYSCAGVFAKFSVSCWLFLCATSRNRNTCSCSFMQESEWLWGSNSSFFA